MSKQDAREREREILQNVCYCKIDFESKQFAEQMNFSEKKLFIGLSKLLERKDKRKIHYFV